MELVANNMVYTINREFNNNMNIAYKNGRVIVNVPWYLSNKKVQEIMNRKREFINKKIKEFEKQNSKIIKNIEIFGKVYKLNIIYKEIEKPELNLGKEYVQINLPSKYKNVKNDRIVKLLLDKLYEKIAEKNIEFLMEKVRIKLGISPEDYELKNMGNIYGKCDANKKIIINPEIVKFDKEIIEYIILHEFCHLKYRIHSQGFKDMIEKNCPNYFEMEEKVKNLKF